MAPYFLIPVGICFYCIQNSFYRPFQVYISLKIYHGPKFTLTGNDYVFLADQIGVTPRTIRNSILKLINASWIGYDPGHNIYFLRGFDVLRARTDIKARSAVKFYPGYLKTFKSFVAGAVIGYLANAAFNKFKVKGADLKRRRSLLPKGLLDKGYSPLATSALSKITGVSIATAHMLKKKASGDGYIDLKPTWKLLDLNKKTHGFYSKWFGGGVKTRHNKVYLRGVDAVRSKVFFHRRRKKLK